MVMFSYSLYGQTFGIKAGMNFSNMLNEDNDFKYSEEYKTKPGFNIGATLDLPLTEPLLFETGLTLNTKGYKREYTELLTKYKITFNLYYIDVPLHLKYMFDLGSIKPYVVAGAYVGFGVSGKATQKTVVAGISSEESHSVNWGNESNSDLKQLDGGLDFGAGVEFGKFQLGAIYSFGLANICPQPENGQKCNNRVLSVSVAYRFVK
jgi:hypothetical protein